MTTLHLVPIGDQIAHDSSTSEPSCVCGPRTQPHRNEDGSVDWLIVHASLDGREKQEGSPL